MTALYGLVVTAASQSRAPNILLPSTPDLVWSLVLTVITGFVVMRYALPAIGKVLDERSQKIEGSLAQAQQVRDEANAMMDTRQAMMDQARADAAKTRDEARAQAADIVKQGQAQGAAEAQRITSAAQVEIEAQRQAAQESLRGDVGTLATALTSALVGQALASQAAQSQVIDSLLDQLEAGV